MLTPNIVIHTISQFTFKMNERFLHSMHFSHFHSLLCLDFIGVALTVNLKSYWQFLKYYCVNMAAPSMNS